MAEALMAMWYTTNPYHCRAVSSDTELTVITEMTEVVHKVSRMRSQHNLNFYISLHLCTFIGNPCDREQHQKTKADSAQYIREFFSCEGT